MTLPTSTYRLQFRDGMTFDRAAELVPYLKALGISHLYASPIFTAASGSTHGYDVTDAGEIDPAIGGREAFERLCAELKEAGLGLILDIVPNHMAASVENAWWRDVLRYGKQSRYAGYFDIDWSEPLTLPILGKPFEEALADGELQIVTDQNTGERSLAYFETHLPLHPDSLAETGDIARLHEVQHWRLTHWKTAAAHLSYRRFFEVTGLVGLRVEDEAVFEDSHRVVLDLVRSGQVQGLRLDHIDGLADPKAYLDRLRQATGPETYIIVEKILGHGETLPADWPISGTTGYEFISALTDLFIDPKGMAELQKAYATIAPGTADFQEGLRAAKTLMVERNFAGEVNRLTGLASATLPDTSEAEIKKAIREMLIAFPVYRTYGQDAAMDARETVMLDKVKQEAGRHLKDRRALEAICGLLRSGRAEEFQRRFQQLSGPVMAKAMEDTLFYRHNRLLAANEVGGEPDATPGGIEAFHRFMQDRAAEQPHGLSATSTHDTKRGEDARARLYALSEEPDLWRRGVERWRQMNREHLTELPGGLTPEGNVEWMLYQALAGIWPEDFSEGRAEKLTERFAAYAEKAIREAKLGTSWDEPHAGYEAAVRTYASALTASSSLTFHEDFAETLRPVLSAGYLNSLSQTLIKLTAPGIPDIYQGAEGFDFSLVDPDNRRPVYFKALRKTLSAHGEIGELTVPVLKQRIVEIGLHLRRRQPKLFAEGRYLPLSITGSRRDHAVAFARALDGDYAITVVPRLMLGWLDPGVLFSGPEFWADTAIEIPPGLQGIKCDLLTGRHLDPGPRLPLGDILGVQPVALIEPD
ncbi:malto-oligosyltrehalose synthase [Rhizobium sp. BG4]|uniref:malto-oligosyltrehalose synthase n=1 Tax=Rhizobium sp. BG4 TaxID=2613770 RepID=UPI00193E694A|nr:malto-oligosyltrehalose synthase [Rhizobium sp. BG4]QRM46420.1 malto-oligosyltrehalose synthase [Rhizobium sp. BG4]